MLWNAVLIKLDTHNNWVALLANGGIKILLGTLQILDGIYVTRVKFHCATGCISSRWPPKYGFPIEICVSCCHKLVEATWIIRQASRKGGDSSCIQGHRK